MNRYLSFFMALFMGLAASRGTQAQTLPPLQPEQDPCGALKICGTSFYTPYTYTGVGFAQQMGYAGSCSPESNSVWFEFEVATAGDILFSLTPVNPVNDYDFAVHDITNTTCSNVGLSTQIRCDANDVYSSPGGVVGLNATSTATYVGPGTGSPWLQKITASPGEKYLIIVNNYGNYVNGTGVAGFTLDLSASTATFVGAGNPKLDSLVPNCDYSEEITIVLDQPVLCSSIAPDGSDFEIFPANATVSAAAGLNCVLATGYTNTITLTFSNPLPNGIYSLRAKVGTDNNTLLNFCNQALLLPDSLQFNVAIPVVNAGPDLITCAGDSLQLNVQLGGGPFASYTVQWTPTQYLSNPNILNPVVKPLTPTTYTIRVVPNGQAQCAKEDVLVVDVLRGFTLANSDTVVCDGASVQMKVVGDSRYTYTWSPATYLNNPNIANPLSTPDTTIKYTVTATYPGCTDSVRDIDIEVQPNPVVFAGADRILCFGDTMHMAPIVTPTWYTNYSYSWTPGGDFDLPATKNPVFKAVQTTNAVFAVTTSAGCVGQDGIDLNVVPVDFAVVSNDTAICPNSTVPLSVSGGDSYVWAPHYWLDDSTSTNPVALPKTSTTFTVYATDVNGCNDTQYVHVVVYPDATIKLPDSVTIFPGEPYYMDPRGNGLYYAWFPEKGLSSQFVANPLVTPEVNTRYFVTATTEHGCIVSDSIDVFLAPDSYFDVPNAFSPNSMPNQFLKIVHKGAVSLKSFRIYNRWGQRVFETTNLNEGWDGRLNGQPQPMGVYVYMVEGITATGKVVSQNGNITLIR
jgi:gliding motility-associated-like protein